MQSTRAGNAKLSSKSVEKELKAQKTMMTFLIEGALVYRENIEKKLVASLVMFGILKCQPSVSEVYMGEVIHSWGLEAGLDAR